MSYSDSVHGRSILILDTGAIRELVAYDAVHDLGFKLLRGELKHLDGPVAYQNCGTFLSSFQKKMTSASVLAELNYWIRHTPAEGRRRLWQLVRDEFDKMGMEENMAEFRKMEIDQVAKLGPVDVSLLEIARRNLQQDPVVLTIDGGLHAECGKARISSSLLIEVCLQAN